MLIDAGPHLEDDEQRSRSRDSRWQWQHWLLAARVAALYDMPRYQPCPAEEGITISAWTPSSIGQM